MPKRPRHWYYRFNWHPLVPAAVLAFFVFRVATAGFSTSRTVGLITAGLWFVLAVLDRLPGHRLSNWVDHGNEKDPEEPEPRRGLADPRG